MTAVLFHSVVPVLIQYTSISMGAWSNLSLTVHIFGVVNILCMNALLVSPELEGVLCSNQAVFTCPEAKYKNKTKLRKNSVEK